MPAVKRAYHSRMGAEGGAGSSNNSGFCLEEEGLVIAEMENIFRDSDDEQAPEVNNADPTPQAAVLSVEQGANPPAQVEAIPVITLSNQLGTAITTNIRNSFVVLKDVQYFCGTDHVQKPHPQVKCCPSVHEWLRVVDHNMPSSPVECGVRVAVVLNYTLGEVNKHMQNMWREFEESWATIKEKFVKTYLPPGEVSEYVERLPTAKWRNVKTFSVQYTRLCNIYAEVAFHSIDRKIPDGLLIQAVRCSLLPGFKENLPGFLTEQEMEDHRIIYA